MKANMATQIFSAIRASNPCLNSLKKVKLEDCAWDTQEVCEELAAFVSEASQLKVLRIMSQQGSRKINVEVQTARTSITMPTARMSESSEGWIRDRGFVRVFDPRTNQTIMQVNTWHNHDVQIEQ